MNYTYDILRLSDGVVVFGPVGNYDTVAKMADALSKANPGVEYITRSCRTVARFHKRDSMTPLEPNKVLEFPKRREIPV